MTWRRLHDDALPDDRLPINVLPYANEEFLPAAPSTEQVAIHRRALESIDEAARRHGMSRRRFVQSSAAFALTLAAINEIAGFRGGHYALANHADPGSCTDDDLHHPGVQLENPPGEFVMDVQTHHVDSDGDWRITNPAEAAFFAAVWAQSNCGEFDRIDCLGRFHYVKELFLDSSTNVCVLSAVPYKPDGQPLPIEEAAKTCELVAELAGGTKRAVMHRFVMPNRGSAGHHSDTLVGPHGVDPVYMAEEFDLMEYTASEFTEHLRGWKVYTPWGDVPNSTGWWLDDPVGLKFLAKVSEIGDRYGLPKLVCTHKGFALPGFDQEKAATRDVGRAAPMFWNTETDDGVFFMVYHSGYDGDGISLGGPLNQGTSTRGPYPLDVAPDGRFERGAGSEEGVRSVDRGVDNFIKALRENGWSARHFAPGGSPGTPLRAGDGDALVHANSPNVMAELGTVWSNVISNPARASFLLGKLIYYVGPRRVIWGTDSLWGGSPQGQIVAFRAFQMSEEIRELYALPHGLDGDRFDPSKSVFDAGSYVAPNPADPSWPTDGRPHPERSIRNGILGRNAADIYRIDPEAELAAITCDDLQGLRDDEYQQRGTRMARYEVYGPRTPAGVAEVAREEAWFRGARLAMNERGFLRRLR